MEDCFPVITADGHEIWWDRTPGARQLMHTTGDGVDVLTCLGLHTHGRIAPALGPGTVAPSGAGGGLKGRSALHGRGSAHRDPAGP